MTLIMSPKKNKRLKRRQVNCSISKVGDSYRLLYKTKTRRERSSPQLSKSIRDLLALEVGLKVVSVQIERLPSVPLKADESETAPQEEVVHQGRTTSASIAFAFILVALFLHVLFVSKEDVKYLE
jgi:hypothetical protein